MIMNLMVRIFHSLTANCDIITEKISESLDHRISAEDRIKIKVHIAFCKFCNRYYRQIHMMHDYFAGRLREEEQDQFTTDNKLSNEARERIKQNLKGNL